MWWALSFQIPMSTIAVSSREGPRRYRRWSARGAFRIGYFRNNIFEAVSRLGRLSQTPGSCGGRTATLGFPLGLRKGPTGERVGTHPERPERTLDDGATSNLAGLTSTALKAVGADRLQGRGAGVAQIGQVSARHAPWVATDDLAG